MDKLVLEDKVGAVKDLHARFEKTSVRKPLGEIPQSASIACDGTPSVNLKSKLQEWESKTYTPFLTPQKQKLVQPENVTRSEPRGRFTRAKQFDFDRDADGDGDTGGGTSRRTSMPAAGAVKNAMKQFLANAGKSDNEVKSVASPYPSERTTKSRKALVPKMSSIEEDSEDNMNDENQPVPTKREPIKNTSESTSTTESVSSFEVGLKGLRSAGARSKLATQEKPMEEWKSPVKSISNANTPCKQKGYIFDEFAVGLKALRRSPKKTEIEDQPLTVSGTVDIDEPPVVSRFEVGLKALRTPKRGATEPVVSESKLEKTTDTAASSFAVGLKALKTPKKTDLINEMISVEKGQDVELQSFKVGLKALQKPEVKKDEQLTPTVERCFGVNLKSVKKVEESVATGSEEKAETVKQTFVTLKPTATRIAKEEKTEVREETKLTDLKMKLKQIEKKREEFEKVNPQSFEEEEEHIDWQLAKSKLKHVTSDEKKKMLEQKEKEEKKHEVEHLDIREEKIDWKLAKTKLKRVISTEDTKSVEMETEVENQEENHAHKAAEKPRMSTLSKSDPMDETLMVDMDDTVSDGELEGLVKCNMSKLDESSLQLGNVLTENKNTTKEHKDRNTEGKTRETTVDAEDVKSQNNRDIEQSAENPIKLQQQKQPVSSEEDSDDDDDDDEISFKTPTRRCSKRSRKESGSEDETFRFKSISSEQDSMPFHSICSGGDTERLESISSEHSVNKSSTCDRKRVRSDDSEKSTSSAESQKSTAANSMSGPSNKSPLKKRLKLLAHSDYPTSCLSPGNLFIDPKTPDKTEMSQSPKGPDAESDMDTQSPAKSLEKSASEAEKSPKSPTKFKRENSEKMETDGDSSGKFPPEGENVVACQEVEGTKVFSSTPASDACIPMKKRAKVDTPMSESRCGIGTPQSPSLGHRKLDCSVEEYSDTTNDIIKRWRERRHFLNLKGSPRTVAERMAEEEEETNDEHNDHLLPQTEDEDSSRKVRQYLSSLPGAPASRESLTSNTDVPDVNHRSKSRVSTASKRSSIISHCSVRSREEMEADLDKGMKELEKRLNMFNDDDDDDDAGSPICSAIRRGPPRLMATFNKTAEKLSKPGKEKTISESDEEEEEMVDDEKKRLHPSTSGSDVLDFIKEKRSRLMQIQDESIHLESDTDADDSQIQVVQTERVSRLRLRPGNRRRRSRSVGRQVVELGISSPKNTFTQKALGRLGLCTPARHVLESDIPGSRVAQSRMETFYTPCGTSRFQRTERNGSVYIVDMNNRSGTSDDSDNRYFSIFHSFVMYSQYVLI